MRGACAHLRPVDACAVAFAAGLVTQGAGPGLKAAANAAFGMSAEADALEAPELLHRLDKDTTGVLLVRALLPAPLSG